jgi:hypothetical protein
MVSKQKVLSDRQNHASLQECQLAMHESLYGRNPHLSVCEQRALIPAKELMQEAVVRCYIRNGLRISQNRRGHAGLSSRKALSFVQEKQMPFFDVASSSGRKDGTRDKRVGFSSAQLLVCATQQAHRQTLPCRLTRMVDPCFIPPSNFQGLLRRVFGYPGTVMLG